MLKVIQKTYFIFYIFFHNKKIMIGYFHFPAESFLTKNVIFGKMIRFEEISVYNFMKTPGFTQQSEY